MKKFVLSTPATKCGSRLSSVTNQTARCVFWPPRKAIFELSGDQRGFEAFHFPDSNGEEVDLTESSAPARCAVGATPLVGVLVMSALTLASQSVLIVSLPSTVETV